MLQRQLFLIVNKDIFPLNAKILYTFIYQLVCCRFSETELEAREIEKRCFIDSQSTMTIKIEKLNQVPCELCNEAEECSIFVKDKFFARYSEEISQISSVAKQLDDLNQFEIVQEDFHIDDSNLNETEVLLTLHILTSGSHYALTTK